VLVSGGLDTNCDGVSTVLSSAELYDPDGRGFVPAASMAGVRLDHEAVRLGDGRVLVVGGAESFDTYDDTSEAVTTAEVWSPG